jgi:chorismate mutase
MKVRGIRGAITVNNNTEAEILTATKELMQELISTNDLQRENIASITFSMTSDLDAVFPPVAVREMGWTTVPLFCTRELKIEGALRKCIRILIHYNTEKSLAEVNHVYLRKAKQLRPDLAEEE